MQWLGLVRLLDGMSVTHSNHYRFVTCFLVPEQEVLIFVTFSDDYLISVLQEEFHIHLSTIHLQ